MYEIIIDRDSVCMGDDIESHEISIEIIQPLKLSDFIDKIITLRYLPYIYGGKATWVIRHKNKSLAVIGFIDYGSNISNYKIKYIENDLELTDMLNNDFEKKIYFGYYAQEDYINIYKKIIS